MSQWFTFFISLMGAYNVVESNSYCGDKLDDKKGLVAMRVSEENTCTWTIIAPENHGVWFLLSALRVIVPNSNTCSSYLMLEEVHIEQKTPLKKYCSSVPRDHVKTRHNQVEVSAYNVTFKLIWNGEANRRKILNPTTQKYSETTESMIEENFFIAFLKERKYIVLAILAGILTAVVVTFIMIKICSKRHNQRIMSRENYEMHTVSEKSDHNERHMQLNEKCRSHEREDNYENIKTTDFQTCKKELTDIRSQNSRACNPQSARESESSLDGLCSYPSRVTHKHMEDKSTDHTYLHCLGRHKKKCSQDSHKYKSYRQVKIEDNHLHNEAYHSKGMIIQNISPSVSITSSDCEDYVNLY